MSLRGITVEKIADLYRVGELIELRWRSSGPVAPPVRHHLLKMLQDGITVRVATQVAYIEKAGKQSVLLDGGEFAVALLSGADNPKTCHALVASPI